MQDELLLYFDESGNYLPHEEPAGDAQRWFAFGGLLIRRSRKDAAEASYRVFRERWHHRVALDQPLHGYKIRNRKGPFVWMQTNPSVAADFLHELSAMIVSLPIVCIACVIDRAGYRDKYFPLYETAQRWTLCKTAFAVLVERSARVAIERDCTLSVRVESSSADRRLRSYYDELRSVGMPFGAGSAGYQPLAAKDFAGVLSEFLPRFKRSELMQIADLCLHPMCHGRYHPENLAYESLAKSGKLIDCLFPAHERPNRGIKYSCFPSPPSPHTLIASVPPSTL